MKKNDKRVLENTTLRTKHTFVGLGIENKDEYDRMKNEGHKHVIFMDRENVADMKVIAGTQQLYQVQGYRNPITQDPQQS